MSEPIDRRRADSAGTPWAGRSFPHGATPFQGDDGSMPQGFADAIRALRDAGDASAVGAELRDVMDAVRSMRLLVPLIAEAGDLGTTDDGRVVDKTQELSVVQVAGPDGAPITPMFSSVEAMRAWNPAARPVPIDAKRAAAAALTDSGRVVIDAGFWSELVIGRDGLLAIVTDQPWVPAWQDPDLLERLTSPLLALPGVTQIIVEPHDAQSRLQGQHLVLRIIPGADPAALRAALGRIGEDELIRQRVASLGVVTSASMTGAPPGSTVLEAP